MTDAESGPGFGRGANDPADTAPASPPLPRSADLPRTSLGVFLLLRRLRLPLGLLICVYAVAVGGFTFVPGTDPAGRPWSMSFLHAFYFVSFMGTTIGLGEVPYPFSDFQRLWATGAIYGTVVAWLYAVGALFGVLQDPVFRRMMHRSRAERAVRRIREPFYLICGYDDAGTRVARELAEAGATLVVVDNATDRVDSVEMAGLQTHVPSLCADASDPKSLVLAGLTHPHCAAVVALTGEDFVNIKIALTARLLNPDLPVLCAARDHHTHARLAAAGANHIVNPFDSFAERVAMTLRMPSLNVIYEALTTQRGTAMGEVQVLPQGRWVLCGADLFTRSLRRHLERLKIEITVIAAEGAEVADGVQLIRGDCTDPAVLEQADLGQASALVAGTPIDIDNLSVALAARQANKNLFIVARQTQRRNAAVFRAAPADLVMLSGYVIAGEVLRVIRAPQLATFLRQARDRDEDWAAALLARMREVVGRAVVESWSVELTEASAPSAHSALLRGEAVTARRLLTHSDGSGHLVHALPLLREHGREATKAGVGKLDRRQVQHSVQRDLLPDLDAPLAVGDRVLFCGRERAQQAMQYNLCARLLPALHHPGQVARATRPATVP